VPIYATATALGHAQPAPEQPGEVGARLQRVRPEDFQ
jgi:hypothetical protein